MTTTTTDDDAIELKFTAFKEGLVKKGFAFNDRYDNDYTIHTYHNIDGTFRDTHGLCFISSGVTHDNTPETYIALDREMAAQVGEVLTTFSLTGQIPETIVNTFDRTVVGRN